jgi:hypothetical protein
MLTPQSPVIPLICLYKLEFGDSIKHSLKVTDDQGVERSTKTRVPIVNSESKGKEFLHFIHKFSRARKLMSWDDGPTTLISKFELHLQGSFQLDWQEILNLTDPNDDRNVEYF